MACAIVGVSRDLNAGFDAELVNHFLEHRALGIGQQMLAIARALMCKPRLLLLDEPSMGLAPIVVQKIFETIRAVAREGVTLLLIEQNARLALQTCDRGYVMESGLITLSGEAKALLDNPDVRRAYLGE